MSNIGQRIMIRRKELQLTQEELAAKMGYKSKSTINKIELGINDIPQSKIVKFAEVLDTTIAYLMGWEEDKKNKPAIMIDELKDFSESKLELMDFVKSVPDDKAELVLRVARSILGVD